MIHRSIGCFVIRSDPQCVNVVIRKIAAVEDDRLETAVRLSSSATDGIDRREVLPRILGWDNPNSRAILRELLQGHFLSHSDAAPVVETH
jgi:hypothetical protein